MKNVIILLLMLSTSVFGQNISNFEAVNVQNNKSMSLNDLNSKDGIVVIFTSNVCPYSVYYEGRITQLVSDYSDKVSFVLINSHKDDKESVDQMKNKISTWGLNVPYLSDKDGKIMQMFGARKSPETFILKKNGSGYKVFYKGAIDNNPQVASDVKEQYLKNNIENLIQGKSATSTNARPIGCMIK